MATRKWGEALLKSGLPLEHLAITTLTALGWSCEPKYEYERSNRDGESKWFELEFIAWGRPGKTGDLNLLVECKLPRRQKIWFFLPCTTVITLLSTKPCRPETIWKEMGASFTIPLTFLCASQIRRSLISLAPKSVWGVSVSRAGVREENSVKEALDQLAFAFVPFCLDRLYSFCRYTPEAVIPALVTTSRLFRLRPDRYDIKTIRDASRPEDIADELPWTWCYYAPRRQLLDHNNAQIERWRERHADVRFKDRRATSRPLGWTALGDGREHR